MVHLRQITSAIEMSQSYSPEWEGRSRRKRHPGYSEDDAFDGEPVISPKTSVRAGSFVIAVHPLHPQAFEACLKGNFFRDKMTPADLEKSFECFRQAIGLDPSYARAYADLSQSYFYLGLFGVASPNEVFPKAKANAVKPLELDETVAAAHNALAATHILYDWDWAAAEAECSRAVE